MNCRLKNEEKPGTTENQQSRRIKCRENTNFSVAMSPSTAKTDLLRIKLLIVGIIMTMFQGGQTATAAGGAFPKMQTTASVDLFDITGDSAEAKLSAVALQGLLNQSLARIFVKLNGNDLSWLQSSGKSYNAVPLRSGPDAGLRTLYANNINSVAKLIVYDTSRDWTFNLALMKGAIGGGFPGFRPKQECNLPSHGKGSPAKK